MIRIIARDIHGVMVGLAERRTEKAVDYFCRKVDAGQRMCDEQNIVGFREMMAWLYGEAHAAATETVDLVAIPRIGDDG